jgi:hypothetical protein
MENSPVPADFKPLIVYYKNPDGTINREQTLDGGSFTGITGIGRASLLKTA